MVKLSIAIPDDVKKVIDRHKNVQWEELARDFIWEYAKKIDIEERIAALSRLSEDDVKVLDLKIKRKLAERYRKLK